MRAGGRLLRRVEERSTAAGRSLVTHHTQAHVCYVSQVGFHFSVSRKGLILDVLKLLHVLRDIEIGDAAFDQAFVICADNDEAIKVLLADPGLREAIQADPQMTLLNQYRDQQIATGPEKLPKDVKVLVLEIPDQVVDPQRLKAMLHLLTATLDRLCWMGVALRQPPGVEIPGPLGCTPLVLTRVPT